MNIITINREFGSGGRELGKRLSDILDYAYYDREIITAISQKNEVDEGYIERIIDGGWQTKQMAPLIAEYAQFWFGRNR